MSHVITDRAHRYRAQRKVRGPRQCAKCGSKRFLTVDHVDNDESNDRPSNLQWLCKSHNTEKGARAARMGIGRRTRQYNPGAHSLGAYIAAVKRHKREYHDAGGAIIHETPIWKRREYARKIWAARRRYENTATSKNKMSHLLQTNSAPERKRNSESSAMKAYADFHGRSPDKVFEYQSSLMRSGDYDALGNEVRFWLEPVPKNPNNWPDPDVWWDKKDATKLVWDGKNHKQLYVVGRDTSLPLSDDAGFDTSKRFVLLGEVHGLSYDTEKIFDQKNKNKVVWDTVTYAHELGEETGERPILIYDQEAKVPILVGGAYYIKDYDPELGASPGIAN